jgi:hypothetical protein
MMACLAGSIGADASAIATCPQGRLSYGDARPGLAGSTIAPVPRQGIKRERGAGGVGRLNPRLSLQL